jgi:hypothetical protein
MVEAMDNLFMLSLVGFVFQLLGLVALVAAAAAALYCAVQMKKVLAELRKQTAALRRVAGEQAEEEQAEE